MNLKEQLITIYNNWYNDPYIYEKNNSLYKAITYHEFIEKTLITANYLINNNYQNKTIILLSENSINLMIYDLAISFFVGKSAIICREWNIEDIIDGINEIDADLIVYSNRYEELVNDIKKNISINTLLMEIPKNTFKDELFNLEIKDYEDIAKIVFSSGTTGKSKGVMLSLNNIFSGLESLQRRCHLTHEDITYMFLPLHHTYASICHFMYSLYTGHRIYLASSISKISEELLEVNPTIFCLVPAILYRLCDMYKDNIDKAFGNRIKYIVCGGAPLKSDVRELFMKKGLCLMQTYALTEVSSSLTLSYPHHEDLKSSGEIYEDIDVNIFNPDSNGIGEIIVKGKNVFKGYTNKSLNKEVFDSNGYFHTGDLGYIKDNKVYVVGRKKKILLTSKGENISALKIENKIKNMNNNINFVIAYVKNDKVCIDIYVCKEFDCSKLINRYNNSAISYEKIDNYRVYLDSFDTRLK